MPRAKKVVEEVVQEEVKVAEPKPKRVSKYAEFCKKEYESWGRKSHESDGKYKAFLSDPKLKEMWAKTKSGSVSEPVVEKPKKERKKKVVAL